MDPWVFSEENKKMVLKNSQFLLNSFLANSQFQNIVFVWVMHEQTIIDDLLKGLHGNFDFFSFSLIGSCDELKKRYNQDVLASLREHSGIDEAVARLPLYQKVASIKTM